MIIRYRLFTKKDKHHSTGLTDGEENMNAELIPYRKIC